MEIDLIKGNAEALWLDYCHEENKKYSGCAISNVSVGYVMIN